jgi:hypothetical protein
MPSTARKHGRPRREAIALLVGLALSALSMAAAVAQSSSSFRVVTHPSNSAVSVERSFLTDAFLKKTTRWPSDDAIYPVDQSADAAVRQQFSEQVLRRSVFAVRSYWQQRIFAGRGLPPPELESDEAVLRYVLSRPGAIGYVSERAQIGSAKVLSVR